jgi:hypothetical protein
VWEGAGGTSLGLSQTKRRSTRVCATACNTSLYGCSCAQDMSAPAVRAHAKLASSCAVQLWRPVEERDEVQGLGVRVFRGERRGWADMERASVEERGVRKCEVRGIEPKSPGS